MAVTSPMLGASELEKCLSHKPGAQRQMCPLQGQVVGGVAVPFPSGEAYHAIEELIGRRHIPDQSREICQALDCHQVTGVEIVRLLVEQA